MKAYNIKNLLEEKYCLIIPEIQRDYVWGSNDKVVKGFLEDINRRIGNNNAKVNVGFLYSYTVDNTEHYVIDGQQRLTTLVLLLFAKSIENNQLGNFRALLKIDKPTMSFSYNVRPLTELFLRQLFLHNYVDGKSIRAQTWYLNEYENDVTIRSILGTLDLIAKEKYVNLTYQTILEKLEFWYFDVKNTSQGEELYITMNSRGQKLTNSEHIKPQLFKNLSSDRKAYYGKKWDEWEEFFFCNRPNKKYEDALTLVDRGINNFIRVVTELETCGEHNELKYNPLVTLEKIEQWFESLKRLHHLQIEKINTEIQRLYKTEEDANFMVLKSLLTLAYLMSEDLSEYERIRQTMRNCVVRKGVVKHIALLKFLKAYRDTSLGNKEVHGFYDFSLDDDTPTEGVFDENDIRKIQILRDHKSNELEKLFWQEEHHCIWKGDISPLIDWSIENGEFRESIFRQYKNLFGLYFPSMQTELENNEKLDLVRRALLAFNFPNYPRKFSGDTNYSFAYTPADWKNLIMANVKEMKEFFDKFLSLGDDALQKIIDDTHLSGNYVDFIKDERLLKYCERKNIQWFKGVIYLMSKTYWSAEHANIHAYQFYLSLKDIPSWTKNFIGRDDQYGYSRVSLKQKKENGVEIRCYWDVQSDDKMMMRIVCCPNSESNSQSLDKLTECGYRFENECYISDVQQEKDVIVQTTHLLEDLLQKINESGL